MLDGRRKQHQHRHPGGVHAVHLQPVETRGRRARGGGGYFKNSATGSQHVVLWRSACAAISTEAWQGFKRICGGRPTAAVVVGGTRANPSFPLLQTQRTETLRHPHADWPRSLHSQNELRTLNPAMSMTSSVLEANRKSILLHDGRVEKWEVGNMR